MSNPENLTIIGTSFETGKTEKSVVDSETFDQYKKQSEPRKFETGAIRDSEIGKESYSETISWTAFRRYSQYMTGKKNKYGAGNFKKGIPIDSYEESLARHLVKYMMNKYEGGDLEKSEDHLAAIVFNVFGIMHEEETAKRKAKE